MFGTITLARSGLWRVNEDVRSMLNLKESEHPGIINMYTENGALIKKELTALPEFIEFDLTKLYALRNKALKPIVEKKIKEGATDEELEFFKSDGSIKWYEDYINDLTEEDEILFTTKPEYNKARREAETALITKYMPLGETQDANKIQRVVASLIDQYSNSAIKYAGNKLAFPRFMAMKSTTYHEGMPTSNYELYMLINLQPNELKDKEGNEIKEAVTLLPERSRGVYVKVNSIHTSLFPYLHSPSGFIEEMLKNVTKKEEVIRKKLKKADEKYETSSAWRSIKKTLNELLFKQNHWIKDKKSKVKNFRYA